MCSIIILAARILAGVPMRVMLPPSSDENESGISSCDTGTRVRRDIPTTAGRSMAVAPTLFINADIMPHVTIITATSRGTLSPASRKIRRPIKSATPVLNNPPDTMYTAHTVMTAGLAKPAKASSESTRPVRARVSSTSRAITSTRNFSVANNATATPMIASVSAICGVIGTSFENVPHPPWPPFPLGRGELEIFRCFSAALLPKNT